MENAINSVLGFLSSTGLGWAQAIIVLLVGLVIIKYVARFFKFGIIKTTNSRTIATFVASILNVVLTIILIIIVFNLVGINTNGIMELLSACVIAIGLSLKDSVSHLASGMIIVSTKPFKEGDYVSVAGIEGTIKSVHMFNTQVKTNDNKIITVPNSSIVQNNIINFDALAVRRVDVELSVAYGSDIDKCIEVFKGVVNKANLTLKTPSPAYVVTQHAESGIVFSVRVWTRKENYWAVKNALMIDFYNAMNANGIEIPYNTIDVNIKGQNANVKQISVEEVK